MTWQVETDALAATADDLGGVTLEIKGNTTHLCVRLGANDFAVFVRRCVVALDAAEERAREPGPEIPPCQFCKTVWVEVVSQGWHCTGQVRCKCGPQSAQLTGTSAEQASHLAIESYMRSMKP